jgi:hypothetical protein
VYFDLLIVLMASATPESVIVASRALVRDSIH